MKPFPLMIAALVCVALYFVILDRTTLIEFAQRYAPAPTTAVPVDEAELAAAEGAEAAEAAEDDTRVHVTARRSQARTTENAVILRGRTEAIRQVDVAAETSGRVISDPIRAGAFVEAGQLLCEIDPGTRLTALAEAQAALDTARARLPEAEAQLAGARAQLAAAEIDANAATRLSASGFASETRAASAEAARESAEAAIAAAEAGVSQARSTIRSGEAAVAGAEEEIANLRISAPFEGYLESDTAELGSLMQPGSLCATVIQLDPMKLVGFVPEADVDRITPGAMAGARLASGREVRGEVTFLSRSADERTRTFRVEVTVPNPDIAIRDGQTADILIQTAGTPAHLLPVSAMTLNDAGELGVRIVVDGVVDFVPVRMIRDTANGVWLSGLPEQADVITVGQEFVTEGVAVRVSYEELTQ
ncbi:putative Co/Zn/Cd efflux system membrane fusion protein [Roseibacterium elongatum DSM 19469]|uniref:Putative Co/Zn/Cd efflux system membrane fusion protein n=1 Tax=Roseicyclus elongatus DSM 19469 TaxID=1294273 RepID=W8SRK0_9RHOB|nr:efflux RND transporter periplasmic adaptor subunit [Roseibacterium elongatum]AHM05165.1 putative Co/Zn/Cd efflux system membrane fusion protein [Roseibacterium elongatum DSM 19469]